MMNHNHELKDNNAGESGAKFENPEPFAASDLPLDKQGRIYHLEIFPEQLAPDILIVGDPGRARMIASTFFEQTEFEHEHRGLVTITGTPRADMAPSDIYQPMRTTITTSGMGTPSLEIILQELAALNEIDFKTRKRKASFPNLHIIRVGTSGGLQAATELGTSIISSYAIGMDNTGLFYESPYVDEVSRRIESEICDLIESVMPRKSRFFKKILPYVAPADPDLMLLLKEASGLLGVASKVGLTASCGGFFAPQGRDIARVPPSVSDLDQLLSTYDPHLNGQKVENMEMESGFLFHFFGGLGYRAAAICTAIANRRLNTFAPDHQESVKDTIRVALLALYMARTRFP